MHQEIEIVAGDQKPNYEYRFHYMIDARAEMGTDDETGEYCEIYAQITPGFEKEVPPEIQKQMHVLYSEALAEQSGINPEYVHPISIEEYRANVNQS